jgi:hypothetical protein
MNKDPDDFVNACSVFFGSWIAIEDIDIITMDTPETILIQKDKLRTLPRECEILKDIIFNLPEEMFSVNKGGRVKRKSFHKVVRNKTGWSEARIQKVELRLQEILQSAD